MFLNNKTTHRIALQDVKPNFSSAQPYLEEQSVLKLCEVYLHDPLLVLQLNIIPACTLGLSHPRHFCFMVCCGQGDSMCNGLM